MSCIVTEELIFSVLKDTFLTTLSKIYPNSIFSKLQQVTIILFFFNLLLYWQRNILFTHFYVFVGNKAECLQKECFNTCWLNKIRLWLAGCPRLNVCVSPNSNLCPKVMVFGGAFGRRLGPGGRASWMGWVSLGKRPQRCSCSYALGGPRERQALGTGKPPAPWAPRLPGAYLGFPSLQTWEKRTSVVHKPLSTW